MQDIGGVGRRYEVKNVAEGYAQNFLLPKKLAVAATNKEIERLKIKRLNDEEDRKVREELLEKNIESLEGKKIVIKAKANESGHLFAAIHKQDILQALKEQMNIEIPEECLDMGENIKSVGIHKIPIKFKEKSREIEVEVI
jgi:large subunit ribosomal protein L9